MIYISYDAVQLQPLDLSCSSDREVIRRESAYVTSLCNSIKITVDNLPDILKVVLFV